MATTPPPEARVSQHIRKALFDRAGMNFFQFRHQPEHDAGECLDSQGLDFGLIAEKLAIGRAGDHNDDRIDFGLHPGRIQEIVEQAIERQQVNRKKARRNATPQILPLDLPALP
jgi:hypothetical protein